jgi:hypothetical protein
VMCPVVCRHWVVPMNDTIFVGDTPVLLRTHQAVMDTGSSVITASTADANTINSVSEWPRPPLSPLTTII